MAPTDSGAAPMSAKILFVCSGNICRSPALEASLQKLVEKEGLSEHIQVDSCGVYDYFLNSRADPLMVEAAKKRGVKIDTRAKQWENHFFNTFDGIFVVDTRLLEMLKSEAKSKKMASKMHLASEFSKKYSNQDIPDPYMGVAEGFDHVMDMVSDACVGILQWIKRGL